MKKTLQKNLLSIFSATVLTILFLFISAMVFAQDEKITTVANEGYTRTQIEYPNGQPTLCIIGTDITAKYNFEKIVRTKDDKKVPEYNLIIFRSNVTPIVLAKGKLFKSPNRSVYVSIVFDDYTIINSRPTLENEGNFQGQFTIPIYNTKRLSTRMIKSIVIKHTNESDLNDIVLDYTTNTQFIGAKQLMDDVYRVINYK
jgi:hypothetical protein